MAHKVKIKIKSRIDILNAKESIVSMFVLQVWLWWDIAKASLMLNSTF